MWTWRRQKTRMSDCICTKKKKNASVLILNHQAHNMKLYPDKCLPTEGSSSGHEIFLEMQRFCQAIVYQIYNSKTTLHFYITLHRACLYRYCTYRANLMLDREQMLHRSYCILYQGMLHRFIFCMSNYL